MSSSTQIILVSCKLLGKLSSEENPPKVGINLLSKLSITSGLKVLCPIWTLVRAGFRILCPKGQ